MRLMRNKRTGRTAVYDAVLVSGGNWIEVVEEPKVPVDAPTEIPEFVPMSQKTPKPRKKKPALEEAVGVTDSIQVELIKGDADESQPAQT